MPFDIFSWQEAISKIVTDEKDSAFTVEHYSDYVYDTAGRKYELPAVIVLKQYVDVNNKRAPYTKLNVFARDGFACQYCGVKLRKDDLTIDHVIPRTRWKALNRKGTPSVYENVVASCKPCNWYKADKKLEDARYPHVVNVDWLQDFAGKPMRLKKFPKPITRGQAFKSKLAHLSIPNEWKPYVDSMA